MIRVNGKSMQLGSFEDEVEAAKVNGSRCSSSIEPPPQSPALPSITGINCHRHCHLLMATVYQCFDNAAKEHHGDNAKCNFVEGTNIRIQGRHKKMIPSTGRYASKITAGSSSSSTVVGSIITLT